MIWRLGNLKNSGEIELTWSDVADIMNAEFRPDDPYDSSAYRKQYQVASLYLETVFAKQIGGDNYIQQLREERQELYKVKTQVRDERNELNRKLREQARMGSLLDEVKRVMREESKPFDYTPSDVVVGDTDMIVHLTDLHVGLKADNFLNEFNGEVLQKRISRYLDEIRFIQETHKCQSCYLVLGGDMVSGGIHASLRIESTMNVIEQVKSVSTLVGNFVLELRKLFGEVHIYNVVGNHSRLSPKKDDQLDGEELDALIPFYLDIMFANDDGVKVHENTMGNGIASFSPRGHLWYAVHGDKDTVDSVVGKLTLITGVKPRGILMGHRHENAIITKHGVKICQSGCVSGTDSYALNHRLSGMPEQLVIITSDRKPVECQYDIQLG